MKIVKTLGDRVLRHVNVNAIEALDDRHVMSWCSSGLVRVWNIETPKLEAQWSAVPIAPSAIIRHGQHVWAGGLDAPVVRTVDLTEQKCVDTWKGHSCESVWSLASTSDGSKILSGGDDGTVRLWDVKSKKRQAILHAGDPYEAHVGALAFAKGDDRAWVWSSNSVCLWDLQTKTKLGTRDIAAESFAYCNATERLAVGAADGSLSVYEGLEGGASLVLSGHEGSVVGLHFITESRLVSWAEDCTIKIWDLHKGACLNTLSEHTMPPLQVICLDSDRLMSAGYDGALHIWDAKKGRACHSPQPGGGVVNLHVADATLHVLHQDGPRIRRRRAHLVGNVSDISWQENPEVIDECFAGRGAHDLHPPKGVFPRIAYGHVVWAKEKRLFRNSPDGGESIAAGDVVPLAVGGKIAVYYSNDDQTLSVWNFDDNMVRPLGAVSAQPVVAVVNGDDTRFVAHVDGGMQVWDLVSGALLKNKKSAPVAHYLKITKDGERLLIGGHPAPVWDTDTLKPRHTIDGAGFTFAFASSSAWGACLGGTGYGSRAVAAWGLSSDTPGNHLEILSPVRSVEAIAIDGEHILVGDGDGVISFVRTDSCDRLAKNVKDFAFELEPSWAAIQAGEYGPEQYESSLHIVLTFSRKLTKKRIASLEETHRLWMIKVEDENSLGRDSEIAACKFGAFEVQGTMASWSVSHVVSTLESNIWLLDRVSAWRGVAKVKLERC